MSRKIWFSAISPITFVTLLTFAVVGKKRTAALPQSRFTKKLSNLKHIQFKDNASTLSVIKNVYYLQLYLLRIYKTMKFTTRSL